MRAFALALVAALSASQPVPLPDTSDVWLRLCGSASSQVVVDAWVDLLCPDCAGEWSTLLALAKNYSPAQLALNMHVFPLPYHTWAFSTANAARILASLNASDSARFAWMDYMFAGANPGQLQFYNDALAGNSTEEVQALLAATAARVTGVSAAAVLAGFSDGNMNEDVRIAWKTGCSRSVTGTPSFFVNGLPVDADGFTLAQWTGLLDPLFTGAARRAPRALSGYAAKPLLAGERPQAACSA